LALKINPAQRLALKVERWIGCASGCKTTKILIWPRSSSTSVGASCENFTGDQQSSPASTLSQSGTAHFELSAEQIERLNNLAPAAAERHNEGSMAVIDR